MKLSIIVPIYNIEKYLASCLDSILNQNHDDYELILINDGSIDGSGNICDNYALNDNRIKVFHQTNKGVSAARNLGLKKATGTWVCFVDGDDRLFDNSISQLYNELHNEKNEILILRSYILTNEGNLISKYPFNSTYLNRSFEGYQLIIEKHYKRGSVCGCIFNREFLNKNSISFPKNIINGEDSLFMSLCHLYSSNISFADIDLYAINERIGSASRGWDSARIQKMVNNIMFLEEYLKNHPSLNKEQRSIIDYHKYTIISAIFNNLYFCFTFKDYVAILNNLRSYLVNDLETYKIKIHKSKIIFMNFSLNLFSFSILLKQLFRDKIKRSI